MKNNMSWADRFALIDFHKPADEDICRTFGLTHDELATARTLRAVGSIRTSSNLDYSKYPNVFTPGAAPIAANQSSTAKGTTTVHTRPETATKKPKVPEKRGRKGNKITTALLAVPMTKVPVDQFMLEHGVSLAVLRQAKRFMEPLDAETQQKIGKINVRQDKDSKTLMIWREANVTA